MLSSSPAKAMGRRAAHYKIRYSFTKVEFVFIFHSFRDSDESDENYLQVRGLTAALLDASGQ